MTCSSAAVEPTSDSALPIRAKLFGGPDKICTWPPLSPKIRDFRGPRDFTSPFERVPDRAGGSVPCALKRVLDRAEGSVLEAQGQFQKPFGRSRALKSRPEACGVSGIF